MSDEMGFFNWSLPIIGPGLNSLRNWGTKKHYEKLGHNKELKSSIKHADSIQIKQQLEPTLFDNYHALHYADLLKVKKTDANGNEVPCLSNRWELLNHQTVPQKIADATAIKTAIDTYLAPSTQFQADMNEIRSKIVAINKFIKSGKICIRDISAYFYYLREDVGKIIKAEKQRQITKLNQLDAPEIKGKLLTTMNVPEATYPALKKELALAIEQGQKKETDALQEKLNQNYIPILDEIQLEYHRIRWIDFQNENKLNKQKIDELHKKNQQNRPTVLSTSNAIVNAKFRDIKGSDLDHLKTITGRKIKREGDTFSVELPGLSPKEMYLLPLLLFPPLYAPLYALKLISMFGYYNSPRDSVACELYSIAYAIKAEGYKKITFEIEYDGVLADEYGRKALDAGIAAGFSEKDITVIVNGQERKLLGENGLFSNEPERLQLAQSKEKEYQADIHSIKPTISHGDYKKMLHSGRNPTSPVPPDPSVATQNAGPQNAGPQNAGPQNAGPQNAGPQNAGPQNTGPQNAGPQNAGPQNAGPQNAGPQNAGPQNAGPQNAGPQNAGPQNAGPQNAGPQNTAIQNQNTAIQDIEEKKEEEQEEQKTGPTPQ